MQEIELKFQIPADALKALQAQIKQLPGSEREHLQAHYVDTLDRRLGRARMALRLRKEGRRWVQTLKAGGSNTMLRLEDNRPAKAPPKPPAIAVDLSLHRGGPVEDVLIDALGWDPQADPQGHHVGLVELYRTDIWRLKARQTVGLGTPHAGVVELALDIGHILAGDLRIAVQELEIELIEGHPLAVIEAAREWVSTHRLWLDTQTKAHRGDRLAKQAATGTQPLVIIKARVADVGKHSTVDEAWRAGLESCLEHIIDNMSELASRPQAPAASLYQWRVGLRRLRTLAQLMDGLETGFPQAAMPAVTTLFRALGRLRDQEMLADMRRNLNKRGGFHSASLITDGEATDCTLAAIALAQAPATTLICLDLLAALFTEPAHSGAGTSAFAPHLLDKLTRWHRHASKLAGDFKHQAEADQHRLRKQCKRLRYAIDLYAPLLPKSSGIDDYLEPLTSALGRLGDWHDEVVAEAWYRQASIQEAAVAFGLGWLQRHRPTATRQVSKHLSTWLKVKTPW